MIETELDRLARLAHNAWHGNLDKREPLPNRENWRACASAIRDEMQRIYGCRVDQLEQDVASFHEGVITDYSKRLRGLAAVVRAWADDITTTVPDESWPEDVSASDPTPEDDEPPPVPDGPDAAAFRKVRHYEVWSFANQTTRVAGTEAKLIGYFWGENVLADYVRSQDKAWWNNLMGIFFIDENGIASVVDPDALLDETGEAI